MLRSVPRMEWKVPIRESYVKKANVSPTLGRKSLTRTMSNVPSSVAIPETEIRPICSVAVPPSSTRIVSVAPRVRSPSPYKTLFVTSRARLEFGSLERTTLYKSSSPARWFEIVPNSLQTLKPRLTAMSRFSVNLAEGLELITGWLTPCATITCANSDDQRRQCFVRVLQIPLIGCYKPRSGVQKECFLPIS